MEQSKHGDDVRKLGFQCKLIFVFLDNALFFCDVHIHFINENEATDFNTRFVQEEAEVRRKVIRTYFICLPTLHDIIHAPFL